MKYEHKVYQCKETQMMVFYCLLQLNIVINNNNSNS